MFRDLKLLVLFFVITIVTGCFASNSDTSVVTNDKTDAETTDINEVTTEFSVRSASYGFFRQKNTADEIEIELSGYTINNKQISLEWRTISQPELDYTISIHIDSISSGRAVAYITQRPDINNNFQTSQWQPNQVFTTVHSFEQMTDRFEKTTLNAGQYLLDVGLRENSTDLSSNSNYWSRITLALLTVDELGTIESVESVGPTCTTNVDQIDCRDEITHMDFSYPVRWGEPEVVLRTGVNAGIRYSYIFDSATAIEIQAGGANENFSETKTVFTDYTDFKGYQANGVEGVCNSFFSATTCDEIQPGVVMMIIADPASIRCQVFKSLLPPPRLEPLIAIAIDLPNEYPIHGFIFLSEFFSDDQVSRLHETIGIGYYSLHRCSAEEEAAHDSLQQEIIENIQNGSSDEASQQNYQAMLNLANSIVVR